jgi:hypothetical protein
MRRQGVVRAALAIATVAVATVVLLRPAELAAQGSFPLDLVIKRFPTNPLITVASSSSLGGNVNGPTVVRVPDWIEHPLGKYYMYFANHMGDSIRLAYADSIAGPWRIHEGGVLQVRDTAFWRDPEHRRIVMWVHGWWTNGERWPPDLAAARSWARAKGYGQFTQAAESRDGLQFTTHAPITKTSYLRVFRRGDQFYGLSRLGVVSRSRDPLAAFETGPSIFAGTPYQGRVRHVAVAAHGNLLGVYFTAIGDAPERVLFANVDMDGDWTTWRAGRVSEVLAPQAPYECVDLPNAPSAAGDIDVPARQIRDPFIFEDEGRVYLFYATCGEQGIAAAELLPN